VASASNRLFAEEWGPLLAIMQQCVNILLQAIDTFREQVDFRLGERPVHCRPYDLETVLWYGLPCEDSCDLARSLYA